MFLGQCKSVLNEFSIKYVYNYYEFMKSLVISVFILLAVGIFFFAFQVVKNADFSTVSVAPIIPENQKDTFIDINRNISFTYRKGWIMHDPALVPGFAPIFKTTEDTTGNSGGFIALAISSLRKNKNIAEDIEVYSTDLPIKNAIASLAGQPIELQPKEIKTLTYKNGLSGFVVPYSGNGENISVDGNIYFFYVKGGLELSFSAFIKNIEATSTSFDFLNKASDSLVNMNMH